MTHSASLLAAVLDSLDSQIAVIERSGMIIYVNQAWRSFAIENGMPADHQWEGDNYLSVCNASAACGDLDAFLVTAGIQAVLDGRSPAFDFEYPCHSPEEQRWFMLRVSSLQDEMKAKFVVSHHIITARKLAEERVEQYNRELTRLAATDKLTLLANRAKLDEVLDNEIYRAGRYAASFSVILLDVDHFKQVNDRFGHPVGDAVLVRLAEIFRSRVRESDLAGRWGGEEFLILLPGCDAPAAARMAEQLRVIIAETAFPETGAQTCSFGVAASVPGETAASLMVRADAALYRAKNLGRNRVEVAASGAAACPQ